MRRYGVLLIAAVLFVTVGCEPFERLTIDTSSLPDGYVGQPYAAWVRTSGGHGNVFITVKDGQLPPGIGFGQDENDGKLDGTPALAGPYLFTVEARDSSSSSEPDPATVVTKGFAITIH